MASGKGKKSSFAEELRHALETDGTLQQNPSLKKSVHDLVALLPKGNDASTFSAADLNKLLPNGGVDPHNARNYLSSDNPLLRTVAQKIISLQSIGILDMNGNPIKAFTSGDAFGKISVTPEQVATHNQQTQQATLGQQDSDYQSKLSANLDATRRGYAEPYPNLSVPTTPVPAVSSPAAPNMTRGDTGTGRGRNESTQPQIIPPSVPKPLGKSKGTGKGTSTSATGLGGNPVIPKVVDPTTFMAEYGVQAAFINSDPSLKALFNKAMAGHWDGARFQAELLNTSWAQTHAESWQKAESARLEAPATYAQSYVAMKDAIARLAGTMGEIIPPEQMGIDTSNPTQVVQAVTGAGFRNGNDIVQWALDQSWGKGLDVSALKNHIAELGKVNLALPGGETGNAITQLKQYAGQMGMGGLALTGGDDYFAKAAQSMMLGHSTQETWMQDLTNQAKTRYKAFAPQFDAGQTLESVAAPYTNALANLLEIDPKQIDLSGTTGYGKLVTDAMTGADPANPTPIPLYQFERQIKARPEWGMTNNAQQTIMPGIDTLLKSFGKVAM